MTYIDADTISQARQVDLLTYLRSADPGNLVHISGDYYCTAEHDSLKINNGKWYWWSRRTGGNSALDYLVKVKNYSFPEAVKEVLGRHDLGHEIRRPETEKPREKKLLMPELAREPKKVKEYLRSRGISETVIDYCINHCMIYESKEYPDAIFIGYDTKGIARYGAIRGMGTAYKGEITGSDKHFSFSVCENRQSEHVHVFEAAIDLLSYATLLEMEGKDWKDEMLLSLAGVFKTKNKNTIPIALSQFLADHASVKSIHLHLDQDEVGRGAAAGIIAGLYGKYDITDEPPRYGKDVNDQLMKKLGLKQKRKEEHER